MQFASIRRFNSLAYGRRLLVVIFGLFLCSVGIVCTYRSGLGLGPWDVLHKGVSLHTPLSFGQASMLTGALVILVGLMIKIRPGVATILNMLLIGIFIDLQLRSNWLPDLSATQWPLRLFVDVIGVFLMGLGTAFYITPRLGAGPRDGLMLRLHILTGMRISIVRAAIELTALTIGFLLGGPAGLGTLIYAFGIGPSVEIGFWIIKKYFPALAPSPSVVPQQHAHTSESDLVPLHPVSHPVDQHSS